MTMIVVAYAEQIVSRHVECCDVSHKHIQNTKQYHQVSLVKRGVF